MSLSLSTRNQLPGTVTAVRRGEVMATVGVRLRGGQDVTAAVTLDAVEELGIAEGSDVHVLIKSTGVALATAPVHGVSIRNRIPGTVTGVTTGGAMSVVTLGIEGGELTAAVTKDAVADLGLAPGSSVIALVKATEVALATA